MQQITALPNGLGKSASICTFNSFIYTYLGRSKTGWRRGSFRSIPAAYHNSQCSRFLRKLHPENALAGQPFSVLPLPGNNTDVEICRSRIIAFVPFDSVHQGGSSTALSYSGLVMVSWDPHPCHRLDSSGKSGHGRPVYLYSSHRAFHYDHLGYRRCPGEMAFPPDLSCHLYMPCSLSSNRLHMDTNPALARQFYHFQSCPRGNRKELSCSQQPGLSSHG